MRDIPLSATPNQELSVTLDGSRFVLRLKVGRSVMVCDVEIDDAAVLTGSRVLAGQPLIPYAYLEAGNFLLLTEGDALPDYAQFGTTQSLVYLTAAEIAAL